MAAPASLEHKEGATNVEKVFCFLFCAVSLRQVVLAGCPWEVAFLALRYDGVFEGFVRVLALCW